MPSTMALPQRSFIRDAIVHLKHRKGASLAQIRKHLESNYDEKLDAANQKMLSSAMKGLVQTGRIQKKGLVYRFSRSTKKMQEDDIDMPGRRRRHHRRRALPHGRCKTRRRGHHKRGYRRRRRRSKRRHRRRRTRRRRHHRRRSRRRHRRRSHRRRLRHRRRRSRCHKPRRRSMSGVGGVDTVAYTTSAK